ncbi:plant cysteine oxidase 2-like isoform X4 [Nicotiana tomentosiformis]|uniref:plant cysteine oxidase 2-like isoform X4 n=1 Tax=Nicotiana tomentosiformis TaxID=4098 RepID=UPI00051C92D4|nr:plant cysteine oxidase 2-like isoform X2 [Nicotiana tomentosiformis]
MNIGRILLTKKSLLTGRRYSHLSKKMKKKTNKESQRRKLIRKRSSKEKNMVQKLYDTCKEVFASGKTGYVPPPSDIHRLKSVLDSLEPKDIKLTAPSLEFSSRNGTEDEAPLVTYIKLHECNKFSIGIFCLPPCGVIPLHNHPGMTVFCKLLAGTMHATSYDWVQNHQQFNHCEKQLAGIRLAKVHFDADLSAPCNASVLFPESGGNLHCFKALTPCILLDVLGPPYSESEGRRCTHYQDFTYDCFSDVKEVEAEEDGTRYAWLQERNEQFVVLGGTYDGPTIQI